jgi:hypothetical protein
MSYALGKCAVIVPIVRSCDVRAAAVSNEKAVTATPIPISSATVRASRNLS